MAIIGRGTFLLPSENSQEHRLVQLIVEDTGIKLDRSLLRDRPESPFDFFRTVSNEPVLDNGELSLVSLPASPSAAFYNVRLSAKNDDVFELTLKHSGNFSHYENTFFKDLNVTFTQTVGTDKLAVIGSVILVLFGRAEVEIELGPKLTEEGLIFESAGPQIFEIAPLGRLTIGALEVGRTASIFEGLEALYSFTEFAELADSNASLDGVGTSDSAGTATDDITLKVERGGGRTVKGAAGAISGITFGDRNKPPGQNPAILKSSEAGRHISTACRDRDEITVAAWIRPTAALTSSDAPPARIVSLSKDTRVRNFTLGQDIDNNGVNRYVVRLRRGGESGSPWADRLFSEPIEAPAADLDYVVFAYNAEEGGGTLYVNGEDKTDRSRSANFSGNFNEWDDEYPLLIGNEATYDRPWYGDMQQLAIYSRAMLATEVRSNYLPTVQSITATLKLTNVPTPLEGDLPVEVDLNNNQLILNGQDLAIVPELILSKIRFTSDLQSLSGEAQIKLWGKEFRRDLNVSLSADEFKLTYSKDRSTSLILDDDGSDGNSGPLALGNIALKTMTLQVDRSADTPGWVIDTDGQFTFEAMPTPLKGPFPASFFLEQERLWFSTQSRTALTLIEGVDFAQVDLRFLKDGGTWRVEPDLRLPPQVESPRNGVSLLLFGRARSLSAELISVGVAKSLSLTWEEAALTAASVPAESFGRLHVTRLGLKVSTGNNGVAFWQLTMLGQIPLKQLDRDSTASLLDFSTTDGAIQTKSRSPRARLSGSSEIKSLGETFLAGRLAATSESVVLEDARLMLFPNWSPLQVNGDTTVEIAWADGQMQMETVQTFEPARIELPNFDLRSPQFATTGGSLVLSGEWLGKETGFAVTQRAGKSLLEGTIRFDMPFILPPGRYVSKMAERRLVMRAKVMAELSADGFYAQASGAYELDGESYTSDSLRQEDLQLFSPPATRNDVLARLVPQARAFEPARGYFLGSVSGRSPFVYLAEAGAEPGRSQTTILPQLLQAIDIAIGQHNVERLQGEIFGLKESEDGQSFTLTIAPAGVGLADLTEVRTQYDAFLRRLDEHDNWVPGAIALVKARIAERLPTLVEDSLYYHYGLDAAKLSVDLQPGMRLRVDYQNYQFVHPGQSGANSGYVGSGTSYYMLTSDRSLGLAGGRDIALDAFLSQLRLVVNTEASLLGAGGVLDTFQAAYKKPYLRLVYPSQIEPLSGSKDAGKTARIVGAKRLSDLDDGVKTTAFHFRGRATVVPEIAVTLQGESVFVPVGTTLRQLMEQQVSVSAGMVEASAWRASGRPRVSRLTHEGVSNEPVYRFVQLEGAGGGDLPLVKGDRITL